MDNGGSLHTAGSGCTTSGCTRTLLAKSEIILLLGSLLRIENHHDRAGLKRCMTPVVVTERLPVVVILDT